MSKFVETPAKDVFGASDAVPEAQGRQLRNDGGNARDVNDTQSFVDDANTRWKCYLTLKAMLRRAPKQSSMAYRTVDLPLSHGPMRR